MAIDIPEHMRLVYQIKAAAICSNSALKEMLHASSRLLSDSEMVDTTVKTKLQLAIGQLQEALVTLTFAKDTLEAKEHTHDKV